MLIPVLSGCNLLSQSDAQFVTSQRTQNLIPQAREAVETALVENFGTGPNLVASLRFPVNYGVLKSGRKLYTKHCVRCHGTSGDGHGPIAKSLNPRPRDYRLGIFKFTSTAHQERATREDLKRTVKYGIPGTYMPSFRMLEEGQRADVVEYVRWLAMRGEFEKRLVDELAIDYSMKAVEERKQMGETDAEIEDELAWFLEDEFADLIDSAAEALTEDWARAEEPSSLVFPKMSRDDPEKLQKRHLAESAKRGRSLYISEKAKCATCHGPEGRGDGELTRQYAKIPGTNDEYPTPGLYDSWHNKVKPQDLARGIYRGGRRPIDLYRRIFAGIKGTPMPATGPAVLSDDEIWDLVNYVLSMPKKFQNHQFSQPAGEVGFGALQD